MSHRLNLGSTSDQFVKSYKTSTIAMITNVLNKNVTPMTTVMVTIPHTNVSLTASSSPTPIIPTKSRNVPIPVNQLTVRRRLTVIPVTQSLAQTSRKLKSVTEKPMTETHNVSKLNVVDVNSVVINKSVSRTNVKLLNAEPTNTAFHSMLMENLMSVMPRPTNVLKSTVSVTINVANSNDVKITNAAPLHVPTTPTVHQTLPLMSTKNVVKTKVNASTLNVPDMLPVTVSLTHKLVTTVPMENVNVSKINVSNINAEPENTVPSLVSTNTSVLITSVLK